MLDEIIRSLKSKLLQENSLEIYCYYYINNSHTEITKIDKSQFTGEVEQIAISSFLEEFVDDKLLIKISRKVKNSQYKKHLKIYHFLGLSIQDSLNSTHYFDEDIQEYFNNQSVRYKYLICKVFKKFEETLKDYLSNHSNAQDVFSSILKCLYLETNINKNQVISQLTEDFENLDIIDLLLLEDFQNIQAIGSKRLHEQLFQDIIWCATEIQSKHRILNNNEDQYNSLFQTLLTAKNYNAHDQTQRGKSSRGKQYGEIDIAIFSKENIPISIFEAFAINSIDTQYITTHLKKLSENYDPNGLKYNYAIIYAKGKLFSKFWGDYKEFIPKINFEHKIIDKQIEDISDRYQQFAGIKIGLSKHQNRGSKVYIYHIFMDMNL